MNSGDHSLLYPLSLKDLLYIEIARGLKRKWDFETEKQTNLILLDLRTILLDGLCFKNDQDKKDYFYNLPYNVENGIKPSKESKGVSRAVKKKIKNAPE